MAKFPNRFISQLTDITREVVGVVVLCAKHDIPIIPHGGLTGLSGGAVSDASSLIVGLHRLAAIKSIDTEAGTMVVHGGTTLQSAEEAANEVDLSVGIDLGARGTATIGGMIATNAGGMEAFRNGSMRNRLLGMEVVLASGEVLNDLCEVGKCNEGYDLKHLFCGAEGTLGIVTRAVLRLTPMVNASFCDAPVYMLIELAARTDESENALHALFSREAISRAMIDCVITTSDKQRQDIWRIREESFVVDNTVAHCQWFDISVPLNRLDDTVAAIESRLIAIDPTLGIWVMGHLNDGNLHYTIGNGQPTSPERQAAIADAVYCDLKSIGGSFSAEHGIGTDKRESLAKYADPEKMRLMKAIKQIFDPQGIMNPGKVL